jgi:uncharacterized membrane protein YccC
MDCSHGSRFEHVASQRNIAFVATWRRRRLGMSAAHSAFPAANLGKLRAAPQRPRAIGRGAARWLQARSFAFTPEQVGIAEGLRAAMAVALLVLAAVALHRPVLAWAAFAAFWTCLTDPGGADGRRLRAMGAFVIVGAVLAALMSGLAGLGPMFTALVLFAVVCLCGSSRVLGPDMAQAGVLANVVAVVAADEPAAPEQALLLAGIFLAGGLLAIVLCLLVWRIHPYRPTRKTVAAVFRDLGEMTAELAQASASKAPGPPGVPSALDAGRTRRLEGEHRWAVRGAIERARSRVEQISAWRRDDPAARDLTAAVEACDRIFAGLIALGHAHGGRDASAAPIPAVLLDELEAALAKGRRQAVSSDPDWTGLRAAAERLASHAGTAEGLAARVASVWSRALADLADGCAPTAEPSVPMGRAVAKPSSSSALSAVRHALRLAVVVVAAYLVTDRLSLPYGYWAGVAAVVVMQPCAEAAWPRMLERIVGSVAGGLAAAVLATILTTPWQILAIVFPLAAATIAVRSVNYTLFVLFLTPLFVLVADLIAPGHGPAQGLALARAADNVLGSVLALTACAVLWPERSPETFQDWLADAVEANLTYAALVSDPKISRDLVEAARRRAGICSSAAEDALHRMRLQGRRRRAHLDEAGAVLASLRRLAGASAAAWLAGDAAETGAAAKRWTRYSVLAGRLGDAVRGVRPVDANTPGTRVHGGLDTVVAEVCEACRIYVARRTTPNIGSFSAKRVRSPASTPIPNGCRLD